MGIKTKSNTDYLLQFQNQQIHFDSKNKPASSFFVNQILELWRYRELIIVLFWTHLKLRYVGSVLGFIWTMLNPGLYILTYWIVFTYILPAGLPDYPLFLIPGFLAWNFTFGSAIQASESILGSKHVITKIAFPIEILTLIQVAVYFVDFLIALALYLLAVIILPPTIPVTIVGLPFVILLHALFTVGLSLILACSSVYFRDIPKLVPVVGTMLFFLTPIFYPVSMIPEFLRPVIQLNPMTQIITLYHELLYDRIWPEMWSLVSTLVISIAVFLFGFWIFTLRKHSFAEIT